MTREPKFDNTCLRCKKPFKSYYRVCKFCSPVCKAMDRWASGKDDVDRVCNICSTTFRVNKYKATRSCGRKCGAASAMITTGRSKAKENV